MSKKKITAEQMAEWKEMARMAILEMKALPADNEWRKGYFQKGHPLHDEAVLMVSQVMHLAEHGHPFIQDEDGNSVVNPMFQDREEYNEIIAEQQGRSLAKHGVDVPESPTAGGSREAKGDDEGEADTVASLKADKDFMSKYMDRYSDPQGHEQAVERMTAAFQAEASDGEE